MALARAGSDVGITYHSDDEGAERTAEEVRQLGRVAEVARVDTTELQSCGDDLDELIDRLGGIDAFRVGFTRRTESRHL